MRLPHGERHGDGAHHLEAHRRDGLEQIRNVLVDAPKLGAVMRRGEPQAPARDLDYVVRARVRRLQALG
jgi:hypothetical protein